MGRPQPVDAVLPRRERGGAFGLAYRMRKTPAARATGASERNVCGRSVADVHRPPAKAERRQHAAGLIAAVIAAATDEAEAEAGAMTPVMVVMVMRPDHPPAEAEVGASAISAERSSGSSARVNLRNMVVLQNARSTFCPGAGFSFSFTHRQSVACVTERVRDNFLNDYSDVKNITQASNRYRCSGFRRRRFARR